MLDLRSKNDQLDRERTLEPRESRGTLRVWAPKGQKQVEPSENTHVDAEHTREFGSRARVPGSEVLGRTGRRSDPKAFISAPKCAEFLHDTQTNMLSGYPESAICVQKFDDSLNSAIHITYRNWPRSSSMHEPRDPPLKVVLCIYCAVHSGIATIRGKLNAAC